MASLAHDAATAGLEFLRPVVGGYGASIHRHDQRLGPRCSSQQRLDALHLRCKAAVERHHQQLLRRRGAGLFDAVQIIQLQREGFLHKYVLAGRERPQDVFGVAVMPRGHDRNLRGFISEKRNSVSGGLGKTELASQVHCIGTCGRTDLSE